MEWTTELVAALQAINDAPLKARRQAATAIANYVYWRLRTRELSQHQPPQAEDYIPRELNERPDTTAAFI